MIMQIVFSKNILAGEAIASVTEKNFIFLRNFILTISHIRDIFFMLLNMFDKTVQESRADD